jgi:phenylpropionate dioxygenase-like ring-hydroxylating dioxygenase large terminal subunit
MNGDGNIRKRLIAPQAKGHLSSARVQCAWYVACQSKDVSTKPLAVTVLGLPMVLFRDDKEQCRAVLDRCPHRNVPLSLGKIVDGELECAYHGWRFDGCGQCTRIPALNGEPKSQGRNVQSWPVLERQGLVWVYTDSDVAPKSEPYEMPHIGDSGYHTVVDVVDARGTLHAIAENALDVPHTAFLHGGLFRQDRERRAIDVIVRRSQDRVEAQYVGESAPKGLIGRILAPGGGEVVHFDRFVMPCIAQVEYKLGDKSHMIVSSALTPIDDYHTRLFAVASYRLPLPSWLVSLFLKPIARYIFKQDARMLTLQTDNIIKHGGEQFVSTELDVLGPHILKLLRSAERGSIAVHEEDFEKRLQMLV